MDALPLLGCDQMRSMCLWARSQRNTTDNALVFPKNINQTEAFKLSKNSGRTIRSKSLAISNYRLKCDVLDADWMLRGRCSW